MRYTEPDPLTPYEWVREHRIGLAPVLWGVPVLALGIAATFGVDWHVYLGLATLFIAGVALIASRVADGWRSYYGALCLIAGIAWIAWAHTIGPLTEWTTPIVVLTCGAIVLAIPHWLDNVKRTQVTMERAVREWPIRADRIRLEHTSIVGVTITTIGWMARLRWNPGDYTVEEVKRKRTEIEGALGLESGTLRIEDHGRSTNSVKLTVVTDDPHSEGVPWEIPTTGPDESGAHQVRLSHARTEYQIGVREDSKRIMFRLWIPGWGARHVLMGGIKGSGKSGLLNRIVGQNAICDDIVQWAIDLKGGMELGPWEAVFDRFADTHAGAMRMLEAVEELITQRMAQAKARRWRCWEVSPENPLVVLVIDEVQRILGTNAKSSEIERVADIARLGRAVGVSLVMATQYPTLEALGTTQIRSQIDQRFCFRMQDSDGEGYVIPGYTVDAHKIPQDRPGTCYYLNGDSLDALPLRVLYVNDATVDQLAGVMGGRTPVLESATETAVAALLPERREFESETPEGVEGESIPEWTENVEVPLQEIVDRSRADWTPQQWESARESEQAESRAEGEKLSETQAKDAVRAGLGRAGPDGARAADLATAATRSRTWTYDLLNELEQSGEVARTADGRWRLVRVGNGVSGGVH